MQAIPRRHFLSQALVAAGLTALVRPLFADEKARATFGLGFSLYGMKTLPLADALKTCAEIGYDNIELCLLTGFHSDPKATSPADRTKTRELLAEHRLHISGLMENFTLLAVDAKQADQLKRIRSAAQFARDVVTGPLPPLETVLGGKPGEWDQVKEKMAGQLRAWAEVAGAEKIVIAIKAHVMSAVNSPERLRWLLDAANSPAIQLAYDYSHYQLENLGLEETMAALIPRTRFIHVKDGRRTPDGKVEFLLPGQGTVDYATLFRKLQSLGYRGDVVVEVSAMLSKQAGYNPVTAAEQSFAALQAGLAKAGLAAR